MTTKAALFIIALAVAQAASDLVKPDFVENVIREQGQVPASSRIVSGWPAAPGQFPYQTYLRIIYPDGRINACGGVIVHEEWMITAAHCTATADRLVISAGMTDILRPQYTTETLTWSIFPTFNQQTPFTVQVNDISIVKLGQPAVWSEYLKPIRIQSSADAHRNYGNEVLQASGYGRTWTEGAVSQTLNWVYLVGVSNADCQRTYGTTIITGATICARFFNVTSQSICQGDSGGPLVYTGDDGVPTLIGISSFVPGLPQGCHSGFPGAFIRPGPFHAWFRQTTGIDFERYSGPPATNPPATEPPATETPATEPPATEPPATEPPATEPPATEPPATEPPATEPPATESPATEPPATEPPATEPTATDTPATEPPATDPPATEPPATKPPATDPPKESQEVEDDDGSSDSSSEEDPEYSELLKRMQVKVKVKVKLDKKLKKKVVVNKQHHH